jgi:hypothetical protein
MPENIDWHSFEAILQRLHREGIYLHPHQLAYFFLTHGLPVDLCYVPAHLQSKAQHINDNYQGDMARLEVLKQPSYYIASLELEKCG